MVAAADVRHRRARIQPTDGRHCTRTSVTERSSTDQLTSGDRNDDHEASVSCRAPRPASSTLGATPDRHRARQRRRHAQRQRLDALQALPGGRDRGVQEGEQGHQDQLRRRRQRQGPPGSRRHGRRLRGLRLALQGQPTSAKIKGGDVLYFPILLGADHRQLQRRRRRQAAALGRRRSRRSSSARSRSGTTRRSPPTTRAPSCPTPTSSSRTAPTARARPRTSPSTSNGAAKGVWKLKSGSTVEWPADTQAGQGNGGVAQIVKSTKGAIGYVDLSDAKASGLKYASIKNQAGKYVEPTTGRRLGRRRRHRGQGQPARSARSTPRATRPIRSPRQTWVHRLREADRQGQGRRAEGVPQVPGQRRPEAARRHRLRAAAQEPAGQGRSSSSTRSQLPVTATRESISGVTRTTPTAPSRWTTAGAAGAGAADPRADRDHHDEARAARVQRDGARLLHHDALVAAGRALRRAAVHLGHGVHRGHRASRSRCPISLGVALFMTQVAPPLAGEAAGLPDRSARGVPSVVFGLWGVLVLSQHFDLGRSFLTAGHHPGDHDHPDHHLAVARGHRDHAARRQGGRARAGGDPLGDDRARRSCRTARAAWSAR